MKRIKCKYCGAKPRVKFAVKWRGIEMCAECMYEYRKMFEAPTPSIFPLPTPIPTQIGPNTWIYVPPGAELRFESGPTWMLPHNQDAPEEMENDPDA